MRRRLVAAIASYVLLATACSGGDTGSPATTDVLATTTAAPTTSLAPAPTTTAAAAPTTTSGEAPPAQPLPFDSWTAVLASLPVADNTAEQARTVADKLGVTGAGVLRSDDYPSLTPGYWVVYTRPYEFSWEAVAACDELATVAPDCYARYLGADPTEPVGADSGTVVAIAGGTDLVVLSVSTGEVIRTIDPFFAGDGTYPSPPALTADGLSIDYAVSVEDFWFSCDASDGHLERMDLATGRKEKTGDGFSPRMSGDGATILYLAASECYPDPAEPVFVLAPIDTVVWRNTATGQETRRTLAPHGDVAAGYELSDIAGGPGDVFVIDNAGAVWRLPLGSSDTTPPELVVDLAAAGLDTGSYRLVGYDNANDRLLVTYSYYDTDSEFTELHAIDPDSGAMERLDAYEGTAAFALDRTGRHLAIAAEGALITDDGRVPLHVSITTLGW